MKPAVKNAAESALVSVAVGLTFLWFLVDASTSDHAADEAAKLVMLSLGLGASVIAHLYFMVVAAVQDGRSGLLWGFLMVASFPIASVVLLLKLYTDLRPSASSQA